MTPSHRRRRLSLLSAFAIIVAIALIATPLSADQPSDPLRAAFEKAQAGGHGTYAFRADVDQLFIPKPTVGNLGQQSQKVGLHLDGTVQLPGRADVQLWVQTQVNTMDPVRLLRDGDKTYLARGDALTPVEDPASMGTPDSNYLGFLMAAENQRELEPVQAGGEQFQRVAFDINGQRFAEYVRDVLTQQMAGKMPPGMSLAAPPQLAKMTGQGELWIDADGLPRRQIIDFALPDINEQYDGSAHMVIDYRDFGQINSIGVAAPDGAGGWRLDQQQPTRLQLREQTRRLSVQSISLLAAVVLALALIAYRRRRTVYIAIAATLIAIFVVSPILQSQRIVRFDTAQAEAAAERTTITSEDLGMADDSQLAAQRIAETLQKAVSRSEPVKEPSALNNDGTPICGDGEIGVDSDGDGLGDYQETCYGTYYLEPDSDSDGITDTLEISGTVLLDADGNPVTWTSNAIRADSNADGLTDYSEWPAPYGEAPSWDPDGDHIPNTWDSDNDDDGVYDGIDLSPYTVSDYMTSFSVNTTGGNYDGYQYIEVQLQPQNQDHLRYSTTYLDWPDDDLGQIMDLDGSTQDVQLAPVLQVYTNVSPQLADKYGISVVEATDTPFYDYVMYIPLQTVTDGGNVSAFYAKAAYTPDEVAGVQWQASLVWIVQAALDQYVNCANPDRPSATTCSIETQKLPIQTYNDTFRLTGLNVTKSQNVEMGIFGTPDSPNEDKSLFNLALGMAAAFLNNQHPDLQEVQQRFIDPNTPAAERWGVTTRVEVDYSVYPHSDEAWAETNSSKTIDFLNTWYQPTDNPSLLYAMQQDVGAFSMDSMAGQPMNSFTVSMDTIHLITQRAVKLNTYGFQSSQWVGLTINETLALMQERYPDMTDEDEFYVNFFYPLWQQGNTSIIAVDGEDIAGEEANDQAILEQLDSENASTMGEFLEAIDDIGEVYKAIVEGEGAIGKLWELIRSSENAQSIGIVVGFFAAIAMLLTAVLAYALGGADLVIEIVQWFMSSLATVMTVYFAIEILRDLKKLGDLFKAIEYGKWGDSFLWAGFLLQAGAILYLFLSYAAGHSGITVTYAAAAAIVQLTMATLFLILSLFNVTFLFLALYTVIDFISNLFGYDITGAFTTWLTNTLYDVEYLVKIPPDVEIAAQQSAMATPNAGPVPGNQFILTAEYMGKIEADNGGSYDDLLKTSLTGEWSGSAETGEAKASALSNPYNCLVTNTDNTCTQELQVRYLLQEAKRNMALDLLTINHFVFVIQGCPLIGSCSTEVDTSVYPEDNDAEGIEKSTVTLYLDVLPATLDELWNWDQLNNPDIDGDGLPNTSDPDPTNWDHDGDTLSDAYEVQYQATRGTLWNAWDSDGDGLGDWDETGIASNAGNPDTDNDGLLDGEEWLHEDQNGVWSGGWQVRLFETTTAFTISDPTTADTDTDGLLDSQERAGQSSPWATNVAPALLTVASPHVVGPGGRAGVFVKPGDPVSWLMTVFNDSNKIISSTITTCLPAALTNLTGGQLTGDVAAPLQVGACTGGAQYAWNFAPPTQLGLGLEVTATLTANVDAALTSSVAATISTTLPYSDTTLVRGDTITVDAEPPLATFSSPVNGAVLKGDSLVVGGTASDPTSWVTAVQVDLADGQGWQTPNGLGPWQATWMLPSDGVYTLQARATDYVGHQSDAAQVSVTVDNTAPAASLALNNGDFITDIDPYETGGARVTLSGSASDNLSGLDRIQVSIDRKPWQQATLTTTGYPTQSDWSYLWRLPSDAGQGDHVISVRAWDRAGNVSESNSTTVVLDLLPPGDMLSNLPSILGDVSSFVLEGHGDDIMNVPLPARPETLAGSALDAYDSATVWLEPPSPLVSSGMTAAWLGDVDGDSRADLAVGLPASDDGAGRVVIVYGQAGGLPVIPDALALSDSPSAYIGAAGAGIGTDIAPAGDVNGDGLSDLLIGDPANGRVFLVFGKSSPQGSALVLDDEYVSNWLILTTSDSLVVGSHAAAAGDVNGDGFDDVLVGGLNPGDAGKAYLLAGQALNWYATTDLSTQAMATYPMPGNGAPATGVGDVNNDGYDDFAISDPLNALGNGRAVFVYLGGMTPPTTASASVTGNANTAVGSQIVALGDVNGDTLPDFGFANGSQPRVVYGRTSGWTTGMAANVTFGGSTAFDGFIAAPGDVNVDGLNDILLGSSAGGGTAYLFHGSSSLASNQPVQAQIANVAAAASAPYAAGADLNCDLSSDLLLVPGEVSGGFDQASAIGPAPAPRAPDSLPSSGGLSPRLAGRTLTATAATGTPALAFRAVENNIGDWATTSAFAADFDGDGKSDVAAWDATASAWRLWHADGYATTLNFSEASHNLPAGLSNSTARLAGDLDGDGLTDLAYWDGSTWQFLRSEGLASGAFSFTPVGSNLGSLAGGNNSQIVATDFDGDGRTDLLGWNGSGWDAHISQGTSAAFNFQAVSNPLGGLAGGNAAALIASDFDGDGLSDLAARNAANTAWTVWRSAGVSSGALAMQQLASSLSPDVTASAAHRSADFDGDGKSDVLAVVNGAADAWLGQGLTTSMPFQAVANNVLQFSGQLLVNGLTGDFNGDGKADYASPDAAGTGWVFQLGGASAVRVVDDDYCATCANDGLTWGVDAFSDLQPALDSAWFADTLVVQPGSYSRAVIHAGRDQLTLQGTDPDAVFIDAAGGTGLLVFPASDQSTIYPDIRGVTIRNLTIDNATTGIQVNYGGEPGSATLADSDNVRLRNLVVILSRPSSTAIGILQSAVSLRHLTLVSNAPGADMIHSQPGSLTSNAIFLQDNLFVALPNTAPLPAWWIDDNGHAAPTLNSHSGFASVNGQASDWSVAPAGNPATLMTRDEAAFLDWSQQVFRLGADSAARGLAGDCEAPRSLEGGVGCGDLGYYTYRAPVTVDATFCPTCDNDGLTWGVDAFDTIQAGIDSGAQRVLIDPGVYRERIALVSGVTLFGSGAGLTVLSPPDPSTGSRSTGSGQALVGAENTRLAGLALITLAGDGTDDGIQLDGAASLTLQRAIVRNTGTALSVTGSDALATLVNDTLVNNDNGVVTDQCGGVDMRNTILAFNQDTALALEDCATTALHTFNAYWRNGHDIAIDGAFVDEPGSGEIFASPRFSDPDNLDFRPQADSPVVDAGDPSDPAPPGSGGRIDIGYAQSVEAAVYASKDYCEQCLNDGLEWQVTAFDAIQDAVDHVPDIEGTWTVGVGAAAGSAYHEHVQLGSGIRLVGAGAGATVIDGDDSGSVITVDNATNTEISGFTITNSGEDAGDAGILVTGASNQITITRNIIGGVSPDDPGVPGNGGAGVLLNGGSTGALLFNTVAVNYGSGVVLDNSQSWLQARYNIVAFNDAGFDNSGGGQIFSDYNLVYNTDPGWCTTCQDFVGAAQAGANDITGEDPAFADTDPGDGNYQLSLASPALDAVPAAFSPDVAGGGDQADLGYSELLALPVSLLLGKEGNSCALGNAGMASVEVGVSYVTDPSLPVQQTAPATWQQASLSTAGDTGSYWNADISFGQGNGLYRVYTRPADQAGNVASDPADWYRSAVNVYTAPPEVTLLQPSQHITITAAALQLLAAVSSTLDSPQVSFLVDGAPITATQSLDGLYGAAASLTNGLHQVQALATDQAGNTAASAAYRVVVLTIADEATLTDPAPGSALASATTELSGFVHFQGRSGTGQVEVLVDGISQGTAGLADPSAQATSWAKSVTLAGDGDHTITLRASRTGGSGSSSDVNATLTLDTVPPSISIDPVSTPIVEAVTFTGEASDDGSGLAGVEVSLNGGRSWQDATLNADGSWSYHWHPGHKHDHEAYPLRARATDRAGNTATASLKPVVDNQPPVGLSPVTFTPAQGSYVDGATTLQITWSAVTDGSGVTSVLAAVDQISDTVPSQVVTGSSYSASLSGPETWYAHLMVRDGSGNTWLRHFGPWNAAGSAGESLPTQSIIVDGLIDVANGEWLTATERLDDDTRPAGRPQDLFATWDDSFFYAAWQGALWELDGEMAIYLDVHDGGTTDVLTVAGNALGIAPLPMEADYAVTASGLNSISLWRYDAGSGWQADPGGGLLAAHANSGGTEVRLPRSLVGSGPVRLMALAINSEGEMWSAFPTNNSLTAAATSIYTWDNLATALPPNAGQPTAHHLVLGIGSLLGGTGPVGPDSDVDFLMNVENADNSPLSGALLRIQASAGMTFQEVSGATCQNCPPGGNEWLLALPDIPAGESQAVDVVAHTASELNGLQQVTCTTTIILTDGSSQSAIYTHTVDSEPPTVSITGERTIRSGAQTVRGSATDAGIGVAQVRWRLAGQTTWLDASGTLVWSFPVDVPASGTLNVEVQAIDGFGQVSETQSAAFQVDNTPPVVEFDLPQVVGGSQAVVTGIVYDPDPFFGKIQSVELQVNPGGPWYIVQGPFSVNPVGQRTWQIVQRLPAVEGEEYQVRGRATDAAGNVSEPTDWQTVIVDSVPPRTTIAQPEAGDLIGPGMTLVWGIAQDGWGVDGVEVSVAGGTWQEASLGDAARALVNDIGRQPGVPEDAVLWAVNVALPVQPGPMVIQTRATDWAGNVESPAQKVRANSAAGRIWLPLTPMNRQ